MTEKETKSCSDCIHYDACYKIEHYGQSPETTALLCELYIDKNDAARVKHGHWIFGATNGHSWQKCSECCVLQQGQTLCFSYCPNCGSRMVGETI